MFDSGGDWGRYFNYRAEACRPEYLKFTTVD